MGRDPARTPPGPAVDAAGAPSIDPSRNVGDLVNAASARQDDLREMDSRHVREIVSLESAHAMELRRAEADRIDAINAVNTLAVQQAAEVQDTRATALADQVAASAEAMRAQVGATATAAATALATNLAPIITSIEQLRAAMYQEQGGKVQTEQRSASAGLWIGLALSAAAIVCSATLAIAGIAVAILLK